MKLRNVRDEVSRLMSESAARTGEDRSATLQRLAGIHDRLLQIKVELSLARAPRTKPELAAYKRILGRYVTAARAYCSAHADFSSFSNQYGRAVEQICAPKSFFGEICEAIFGEDADNRRINRGVMSGHGRLENKFSRAAMRTTEIARELDLLTARIVPSPQKGKKRRK